MRFLSFFFFSSLSPFDEGAASEGTCDLSEPAFDPVGILLYPGAGGTGGAAASAAELDFSDSTPGRYVVSRTGLLGPGGVAERLLSCLVEEEALARAKGMLT